MTFVCEQFIRSFTAVSSALMPLLRLTLEIREGAEGDPHDDTAPLYKFNTVSCRPSTRQLATSKAGSGGFDPHKR